MRTISDKIGSTVDEILDAYRNLDELMINYFYDVNSSETIEPTKKKVSSNDTSEILKLVMNKYIYLTDNVAKISDFPIEKIIPDECSIETLFYRDLFQTYNIAYNQYGLNHVSIVDEKLSPKKNLSQNIYNELITIRKKLFNYDVEDKYHIFSISEMVKNKSTFMNNYLNLVSSLPHNIGIITVDSPKQYFQDSKINNIYHYYLITFYSILACMIQGGTIIIDVNTDSEIMEKLVYFVSQFFSKLLYFKSKVSSKHKLIFQNYHGIDEKNYKIFSSLVESSLIEYKSSEMAKLPELPLKVPPSFHTFCAKIEQSYINYGIIYEALSSQIKLNLSNKYMIKHLLKINFDASCKWCVDHDVKFNETVMKNILETKIKGFNKTLIFPRINNINVDDLRMTKESYYSVSFLNDSINITNIIKSHLRDTPINQYTITDGTSNVGGNAVNFCQNFKFVNCIEIDKTTSAFLEHNLNLYKFTNFKVYNEDYLNVMMTLTQDIIFMDPPWSGLLYKYYDNIDLSLSNTNIINLIPSLLTRCKLLCIKVPFNYNFSSLLKKDGIITIHKLARFSVIIITKN